MASVFELVGRKFGTVEINGVTLEIQSLSAAERTTMRGYFGEGKPEQALAYVAAIGLIAVEATDEAVERLYNDSDSDAVQRIADAVLELSGLGEDAEDAAKND